MENLKQLRAFVLMLLVIGGGLFMSASAQGHSINGSVKDDTGAPLPGVNVVIKGTMVGTISDIDGNYRLENIAENAVLVFSFSVSTIRR